MNDARDIVVEEGTAEKLRVAVETLAARTIDLTRKAWLSVEEAAEYLGVSPKYIRTKISQGSLSLSGEPRAYRIYRPHLDEQVARNWPRLEVETTEEAVARVLTAQPPEVYLPRLRRPARPRGSAKPLVFK